MSSPHSSRMFITSLLLCIVLCTLLCATSALATLDLLTPTQGNFTNNSTVTFEYYVSMQNLTSCNLLINGVTFAGQAQTNAMNSVTVQSIAPGNYAWNVSCTGDQNETSVTRNFAIDLQPPTMVMVSPANGTYRTIPIDIIPNDDITDQLSCQVAWKDQVIDSFQVSRNTHYTKNYTGSSGNGTLITTCSDQAGNTVSQARQLNLIPDFGLFLGLEKQQYGLTEPVRLTINTLQSANVTVDICPDQPGFVQCTTAILTSTDYPQTITLPYMNKTGNYIVEGIASIPGQSKTNQSTYQIVNTINAHLQTTGVAKLNKTVNLTAIVDGGVGPYRLTWSLTNGSTITGISSVAITFPDQGTYVEYLTVMDAANNVFVMNQTYIINPIYNVAVQVVDVDTGIPVTGAEVQMNGQSSKGPDGTAYFDLEPDTYTLFASGPGYIFDLEQVLINNSQTITIPLNKSKDAAPKVTIDSPIAGSTVYSPVSIKYTVQHTEAVNCTLYSGDGTWFGANNTQRVGNGQSEFLTEMTSGQQSIKVECADSHGFTGTSQLVTMQVSDPQAPKTLENSGPTQEETSLQTTLETLNKVLDSLDSYGPKEKDIIAVLGFDKNVRQVKKTVQQAIRDINALQFRTDLNQDARLAELKRIADAANAQVAATPLAIVLSDSTTYVRYLKQDEVDDVAASLAGLGGMSSDPNVIKDQLVKDQQKFTLSTTLSHVDYVYTDQSTKSITVVSRSFTYGSNLSNDYHIYEIIPKEVAKSAKDLTLITAGDTLKDDPVLQFPTGDGLTYIIPKKIDFTRVEDIKTVIARPYTQAPGLITGFAFAIPNMQDTNMWILILVIALIIAGYYFKLYRHLSFLFYKSGKKEKVHYVRVMINDALDNIAANNYERASFLYKEVHLTYDSLSVVERNELHEEVMNLVKRLDTFYFNMVLLEMDTSLKQGDMQLAVQAYEKLTGTFERLEPDQQQQLVSVVTAMAQRMGMEAKA